jgi:hypothetical protein
MRSVFRIFLILKLLAYEGISNPVFTQDFEVAPVLVSFDANPGETQSRKLTIRNHNNERQRFLLNLSDYTNDENGAKKSVAAGTTDRSMINLLSINPSFIELNPNETAEVDLNLTVPQNFFKTCWGMVQVQIAKEQTSAEADKQLATGVLIMPRIIVLVKQSPKANQNYQGKVSNLREITKPEAKNKSFEATLSNTGDKILEAKVFLALANLNTAQEEVFNSTTVTVYPGQNRKVELVLPVIPEKGNYALAFMMDYGKRAALEGAQIMLELK